MEKKYKSWRIAVIVLFPLLLSSCVSQQRYPSDWSSLILSEEEKFLDISGTYVNEGERTDRTKRYLSDAFGKTQLYKSPAHRKKVAEVTHVAINQSNDGTLEILFWNNDKLVDKNIYSKKKEEYICTPEGVRIRLGSGVSSQMGEGMMPVSVSWLTLYLTKNTDGELVIGYTSSGIGLFLIVPVGGSASDYMRFKQKH